MFLSARPRLPSLDILLLITQHPLNMPIAPKYSQAARIIAKFGNARGLAAAIARHTSWKSIAPSNVYRWNYPKEKGGTGGIIPTASQPFVIEAARLEGVFITTEDWDPRPRALPTK